MPGYRAQRCYSQKCRMPRRGITLLFVLSLIVLFLLMGAAFVSVTGNFMRTSRARARIEVRGDSARTLIDRAVFDLIRGPTLTNTFSPLRGQDLLSDQYGFGARGTIAANPPPQFVTNTSNQLVQFSLGNQVLSVLDNSNLALSNASGAYDGMVMTFITNTATADVKGISQRIFHYQVETDPATGAILNRWFIFAPQWSGGVAMFNSGAGSLTPADLVGAAVLINGRDFSGPGAAEAPTVPPGGQRLTVQALTPNRTGLPLVGQDPPSPAPPVYYILRNSAASVFGQRGTGQSVNEPYDAVDIQNTFLAAYDRQNNRFYPSFYGTGAVNYGFRPAAWGPVPDLINNTTGVTGADGEPDWDVDNDGDGRVDSIWMDIGLPIMTDTSGRQYKPLAAYMVMDMEGRFNLNAHGHEFESNTTDPTRYRGGLVSNGRFRPLLNNPAVTPFGSGYGPAEVSLLPLFPNGYDPLLSGNGTVAGRYGEPNGTGVFGPGFADVFDPWSVYKLMGYPSHGLGNTYFGPGSLFGSRMDLLGNYAWGFPQVFDSTGLLPTGMPWVDGTPPIAPDDEVTDNPYEMNYAWFPKSGSSYASLLGTGTENDQLISAKELERILRMFDIDAAELPPRLLNLMPTELGNPANRYAVTSDGWEVPVSPTHLVQTLYEQLTAANPAMTEREKSRQIELMIAPELIKGLRIDLNRLFGNGRDDNGNGVVDEYFVDGTGEAATGEFAPYPGGPIPLDLSHNGFANPDNGLIIRETLARHLYCLAVIKFGNTVDIDGDGLPISADPDDARIIAQWAINVVDFRDPDAIMTPFEYDANLANGWNFDGWLGVGPGPDGIIGTGDDVDDSTLWPPSERGVVWGCERPELVITETLAAHDRRTEDQATGGTIGGGDDDFDSRLAPVATAFIELYAPQVGDNDVTYPPELYTGAGVDLARKTPSGHPVWRMMVVKENGTDTTAQYGFPAADITLQDQIDNRNRDPDDPNNPPDPAAIFRYLYFTDAPAGYLANGTAEMFYPLGIPGTRILPVGQHAVIGSSGNVKGQYTSTFGRRLTGVEGDPTTLQIADTRQVQLDPLNNIVRVRDYQILPAASMITRVRPNVVAIPVNYPRSFNVSDPPKGYPATDALGNPTLSVGDGDAYVSVFDTPLDKQAFLNNEISEYDYVSIRNDRTTPTFRVVHLQRLANPLADWNPVTNPYRTVDSSSVNLTAYNGVTSTNDTTYNPDPTIGSGPDPSATERARDLASMERGRNKKFPPTRFRTPIAAKSPNPDDYRNILFQDADYNLTTGVLEGRPYLYRGPGAVNEITQAGGAGWRLAHPTATLPGNPNEHYFNSTIFETLGAFNDSFFDDNWPVRATVQTAPTNDAFRNGIAPAPAPVGLDATKPFNWLTWNNRPFVSQMELTLVPALSSSKLLLYSAQRGQQTPYTANSGFSHLPNFFNDRNDSNEAEWSRLLDFCEVPSRYVGTDEYFSVNTGFTGNPPLFGLNPPYHGFSRYREPGKVNINTVFDVRVWNGVMGEYATAFPYNTMAASRANSPFRPAEAADAVVFGTPFGGVDSGLFRQAGGVPGTPTTPPLLDYVPATQEAYNNTNRNAYFRYDARQRLGNLLTTRSSTFAIWITIGYFEVDNSTATPTLTQVELGSDTGQIRRHRAFFILDRSVPVGFEPGINHNVEKALQVKSYIE